MARQPLLVVADWSNLAVKIVDPSKLDSLRIMIDNDIVQLQMEESLSIPEAARQVAVNLGVRLLIHNSWGSDWWTCIPVPVTEAEEDDKANSSSIQEYSLDVERAMNVAAFIDQRLFAARSPYDAAVAAIISELDNEADIFLSPDDFEQRYSKRDLVAAMKSFPFCLSSDYLNTDPFLGETQADYYRRLEAILIYYETSRLALSSYCS